MPRKQAITACLVALATALFLACGTSQHERNIELDENTRNSDGETEVGSFDIPAAQSDDARAGYSEAGSSKKIWNQRVGKDDEDESQGGFLSTPDGVGSRRREIRIERDKEDGSVRNIHLPQDAVVRRQVFTFTHMIFCVQTQCVCTPCFQSTHHLANHNDLNVCRVSDGGWEIQVPAERGRETLDDEETPKGFKPYKSV